MICLLIYLLLNNLNTGNIGFIVKQTANISFPTYVFSKSAIADQLPPSERHLIHAKLIPSKVNPIEYKPGERISITKYIHPLDFPGGEVMELNLQIPVHDQRVLKGILPTNYQIVFFSSAAIREFTRLYHFKNALVTSRGVFCRDCQVKFPNDHVGVDTSSITVSDKVIEHLIIGKATFIPWGHFMTESPISGLIYFPEEVVNKSQIYFYQGSYFYSSNLNAFGWGHIKHASISWDATLVKNLYMSVPNDFVNGQTFFYRLLRERLMKRYNSKNVKPTQGIISNKPQSSSRFIKNFDPWVKSIKDKYPDIPWTVITDDQITNTGDAIKVLAATKYFITPCGSAAFKIVYMHENTGICIVGMAITDWANLGVCQAMGVWCTYSYNPGLPWIFKGTGIIDIEMNLRFASYLIYAVDHQKWPSVTEDKVEFLFEQNIHRKILDIDPASSIQVPCDIDSYYYNLTNNISQPKRCESIKSLYFGNNIPMR
ncbi:hypothetical protein TVAG_364100 [Trichomonas vaginalis G3]|uniref:Glycosyltransferase 61 catalytic domain-containing protein n=1 Tax=Trichomonas vaginalis (strain ATCC PRA-98 / G3) TaxID=412133 RepID=A2E9C3_TRIV3|nr:glycosyltransferase family [Trichomonas vaginalis G3]EAY10687.1 hypothetical protein TVAG_364100 [Trichomonas vaginalis G3]KAI5538580.1 glycosyltransferase family [Trichomonas vaginalis G3]|eukprot:XP_001322910.1 hypothetical protein [Trichomonas vaginalis G3]